MGKKRENKLPYIYGDGNPLPESVTLDNISDQIDQHQNTIDRITKKNT